MFCLCLAWVLYFRQGFGAVLFCQKSNLVGLGTGNLNVEGFMAFSTHWSAHLPA